MNNLKVSRVVEPQDRPSQDRWMRELNVSTGYVKPVNYFQGNEFDTRVFTGHRTNRGKWSGILHTLLNLFTWVG